MYSYQYESVGQEQEDDRGHRMHRKFEPINSSSVLFFAFGLFCGILLWVFDTPKLFFTRSGETFDVTDEPFFMHISDIHVDHFFDPNQSMFHGACHTCDFMHSCYDLSNKSKNTAFYAREQGYAFGRYDCNPPPLLLKSLLAKMQDIDPDPPVIVFTGDISPHGYPDDSVVVTPNLKLENLCRLKFDATQSIVRSLVEAFPNTRWAFAMGNNDHFPKDTYWQPYIDKFGSMLLSEGFFTQKQYDQFVSHGSSSVDVANVRYLCIDFSLFLAPRPGASSDPTLSLVRDRLLLWVEDQLRDADESGLYVYVVGHQPMTTKDGRDEMNTVGKHYLRLKELFGEYADVIKVGLFGHHNLAFMPPVLSTTYLPIFPSIVAPGVSPRGRNQPSFHVVHRSSETGTILDFTQYKFNLLDENTAAKSSGQRPYLGAWDRHSGSLQSWRKISGANEFTTSSLSEFLHRASLSQSLFFSMEVWRRAGYIGDETPESFLCKTLFDRQEALMKCMFPMQNPACWFQDKWIS